MQWKSSNSLAVKIFTVFWLLIAILITALTLLPQLDGRHLQPLTTSNVLLLTQQTNKLSTLLAANPNKKADEVLQLLSEDDESIVYLTDASGRLVNPKAPRKMLKFIIDSISPDQPLRTINTYRTYIGPQMLEYEKQPMLVYISVPNKKKSLQLTEWLVDNPLLLLLTAVVISAPLCVFFAWYLTLPLRQLIDLSTQVARGDLNVTFPDIKNSDELTMLTKSIQIMMESLRNMLNNQQRLLSDISHELRSPLTRLSLALAITKRYSGETKELQRISLEINRMEKMIAEMLNLSQIQLHQAKKEDIALDDFLEDLFLDAQFEAEEHNKLFTYPPLSKVSINIYPELAYRAIENIIRNSIKYCQQQIQVKINISKHNITLTISNDGPTIPEKELNNIFRPFYRLNESRERETGGAGLGLSIAENAMFKHGGKIWADNHGNQVSMHLQFPRFN